MKFCAIICEYNPFHNGHKYLIEQARRLSGCDGVLCIMSSSFTQRGEMCISDSFTRASHAVLGGADCVIRLPVSFSVAPAEIFARGAVRILSAMPSVSCIAFGCENDDRQAILSTAQILANEPPLFKQRLKNELSCGASYKTSMSAALSACGADGSLASSPNNVLALEYVKEIIKQNAKIDFLPVKRIGSAYSSTEICDNFSSAAAIRESLGSEKVRFNLPTFVYDDIKNVDIKSLQNKFILLSKYAVLRSSPETLRLITGCTEGLENKIKKAAENGEDIIATSTGRRYSSSRIRRVVTSALLNLNSEDTNLYLENGTYIKPLAINKSRADDVLATLALSALPVVIKKNDLRSLSPAAKSCFDKDEFADKVRAEICGERIYGYTVRMI